MKSTECSDCKHPHKITGRKGKCISCGKSSHHFFVTNKGKGIFASSNPELPELDFSTDLWVRDWMHGYVSWCCMAIKPKGQGKGE